MSLADIFGGAFTTAPKTVAPIDKWWPRGNLTTTRPLDTDELASLEEARSIAKYLGNMVGGGVLPETPDQTKSGIFILDWYAGGADFSEPLATDEAGNKYFMYYFRFANGAQGMSVGLIRHYFRQFPTSPPWVFMCLADEANRMGAR